MIVTPQQTRHVVDRALRIAKAERTPTCIIVPNDVQEMKSAAPARQHGTVHSGVGYAIPRHVPSQHDLQRAADVLNAGKRVAILAGAGALQARQELIDVAEVL